MPEGLECLVPRDEEEALALLEQHPVSVLCLGEGLPGESALRFLERAVPMPGAEAPNLVVVAGGERLELFSELVERDDLFYLSRRPPTREDLVLLLEGAAANWHARREPKVDLDQRRRQFLREAAARLDLKWSILSVRNAGTGLSPTHNPSEIPVIASGSHWDPRKSARCPRR